jgi:hypothetical protein
MGSYIHAESVAVERESIRGMIALEMIGYFAEDFGSQEYPALNTTNPETLGIASITKKWPMSSAPFTARCWCSNDFASSNFA